MPVTMNMLVDHLKDAVHHVPNCKDARISWAALIVFGDEDDSARRDDACRAGCDHDIEADTLYCGCMRDALRFARLHPKAHVLGVQEKTPRGDGAQLPDAQDSPASADQIIMLADDRPLAAIYEDVRTFLMRFERWDRRMRSVLLNHGGYQDFIDASSTSIFKDFISITDSSFRLVAYSKDVPVDDPVARHLIERGYHSSETISRFKRYGAIKRWQRQSGIARVNDTHIVQDPSLSYVFLMQGSYFVHVVLQCTASGVITEALVDTFRMLIDYLELYVRYDWTEHHRFDKDYTALLRDLVMGRPQNEAALTERLSQFNIARHAPYRLIVAESALGKDDDDKHMLGYHARRMSELMPLDRVGIFQGRVLALVDERNHRTDDEAHMQIIEKLRQFQRAFDGSIGISDPFDCVTDLPLAHRQARLAIQYATSSPRSLAELFDEREETHRIYRFETHFSAYLHEHGRRDAPLAEHCARSGVLSKIAAFDKEHGTNDLRVLYFYLVNERRANQAAQALGMPRNTLVYRIAKLQERFEFNLEDRYERERIMLLYYLMTPPDEKHSEASEVSYHVQR